ncbi:MAG: hypothetical protein ACRDK2_14495 [Solirubrobacteraceae bacterium]
MIWFGGLWLEEDDRGLLALLDGTRDRGALLDVLPTVPGQLEVQLQRFASLGLLEA